MKLVKMFSLTIILFIAFTKSTFGINEIITRVPDVYQSKPGYIDKATLVVEPHGGYSEQSLYLEYSDHGQFRQGQKVEIIHRFELPQGSVVNDLWLWIGDSVMKAICMDTWTARSIYDSIVSMKRDPAFLTKKGNQYELHIYPLEPGQFRKIKLNFITPTRWIGQTATVELPFLMLKSNNNSVKPLEVLFRTKQDIWGKPGLIENPDQDFSFLKDTSGYHYKRTYFTDISQYSSLKLSCNIDMQNGIYFDSKGNDTITYFQSAFKLKDAFGFNAADSISKKNLIGIDLSGSSNKNYSILIPNLKKVFKSSLKPNDYFNVILSGAGNSKKLSPNWMTATSTNIDNVLDSISQSKYADSIAQSKLPNLTYCDVRSTICWGFTGMSSFANVKIFDNIYLASNNFSKSEIVASYDQGNERVPSSTELPQIIACLDTFFIKGGRFLTYYDFNRDNNKEPVATHYIKGLRTKAASHSSITLYRNINGNIGRDFPESIDHAGTYTLTYNDPDVKIELQDKDGNPAVISKKIGNGIIVVSGIWSMNDDAPLKKLLGIPLFGLNNTKAPSQLGQTLNALSDEFAKDQFDKALIISNSDSLITYQDAFASANNYASKFTASKKPVFNSINLIDGTVSIPPTITVDNVTYNGSGYLLKKIADNMHGIHFETSQNDWDFISSSLYAYSTPSLEEFVIQAYADNKADNILEIKEIKLNPQDNNSPKFFIGSATAASEIKLNISAKFVGIDSIKTRSYTLPVNHESTQVSSIIPAMLGYEKIKGYLSNGGIDTAKIVQLALKYNLLCDYTSLLALEPNEKIHFLQNPLDESGFTNVKEVPKSDSLGFSVFPNPFNSQTRITINVKCPSRLNLYIYNILGQLVKTIAENEDLVSGKSYVWNGRDSYNQSVSSGIYFTRAELKERDSNKSQTFTRKLILLK